MKSNDSSRSIQPPYDTELWAPSRLIYNHRYTPIDPRPWTARGTAPYTQWTALTPRPASSKSTPLWFNSDRRQCEMDEDDDDDDEEDDDDDEAGGLLTASFDRPGVSVHADTVICVEWRCQAPKSIATNSEKATPSAQTTFEVGYTPILSEVCHYGDLEPTLTLAYQATTTHKDSTGKPSLSEHDRRRLEDTLGINLPPPLWARTHARDLTGHEFALYEHHAGWKQVLEDESKTDEEVSQARESFALLDYGIRQREVDRGRYPGFGVMPRDWPDMAASLHDAYGNMNDHRSPVIPEPDDIISTMLRDYGDLRSRSVALASILDPGIECERTTSGPSTQTRKDSGYESDEGEETGEEGEEKDYSLSSGPCHGGKDAKPLSLPAPCTVQSDLSGIGGQFSVADTLPSFWSTEIEID